MLIPIQTTVAAAAAAECDVPCVTRERSLRARTASPAADRLSECPVADQLCRGLRVFVDEKPGKTVANVPVFVAIDAISTFAAAAAGSQDIG